MIRNNEHSYGVIAKLLHWLSAISIIGLFALGLWMVELSYYSEWYTLAPHYHVSVGILLFMVMLSRVLWRLGNQQPTPLVASHIEKQLVHWAHRVLYVLIFIILISGYLIPTADNRGIDVFDWFSVPALGELFTKQTDYSGLVHLWGSYLLIGLVLIHISAALKHHFINRDGTLKRMLR